MGDDDCGHVFAQGRHRLLPVLVNVYDEVRGPQLSHGIHIDIFGAANLRDRPQGVARMNAKPRTAHELVGEPQGAQQLGDARHQRNNASRVGRWGVKIAEIIGKHGPTWCHARRRRGAP